MPESGGGSSCGSARKPWQRGIELIEWTFDPLELKNAFFNLERLGADCAAYAENQYG
jgi:predicted GNAT superfamily acetyltransferase